MAPGGGHDTLDPFVGLAFIAAATSELRLLTYLAVLPYRNPFLIAKTVATLDALSGGRVDFGLGTGYLKSEYFALGVDFDERNALFDESLEVMKLAWTGEPVTYQGLHFSARDVTAMPTPLQKPYPPIWLGGNSKLTRRRVVEQATGWLPMLNPPEFATARRSAVLETVDDFAVMLADLRAHAERIGRTEPIEIMFCPPDVPLEPRRRRPARARRVHEAARRSRRAVDRDQRPGSLAGRRHQLHPALRRRRRRRDHRALTSVWLISLADQFGLITRRGPTRC